jgi:hypothetical protein
VNPNVNDRLWVIVTCQCQFLRWIPLVRDVENVYIQGMLYAFLSILLWASLLKGLLNRKQKPISQIRKQWFFILDSVLNRKVRTKDWVRGYCWSSKKVMISFPACFSDHWLIPRSCHNFYNFSLALCQLQLLFVISLGKTRLGRQHADV